MLPQMQIARELFAVMPASSAIPAGASRVNRDLRLVDRAGLFIRRAFASRPSQLTPERLDLVRGVDSRDAANPGMAGLRRAVDDRLDGLAQAREANRRRPVVRRFFFVRVPRHFRRRAKVVGHRPIR